MNRIRFTGSEIKNYKHRKLQRYDFTLKVWDLKNVSNQLKDKSWIYMYSKILRYNGYWFQNSPIVSKTTIPKHLPTVSKNLW